jgi:BirA family transcriptional regulator, biotin operon repressor / biotin---[acetyl-CoA-carboxylase] ligase
LKSTPSEFPTELATALERARPRLGPIASTLLLFDEIGSTNDEAAERSGSTGATPGQAEGLVVVADAQRAGRGRRGHTWFSPPGAGLYVSVVLQPSRARVDPGRATILLTLMAGVSLAEGIREATGLQVDLKWPNDLQVTRRKLGGILAEASRNGLGDAVIIGYGINVSSTALPPELRDRATSLESELGRAVDRYHVLVETFAALAQRYADLLEGRFDAILDAWRGLSPGASGARVTWTTLEGTRAGVTAGIDDRGALLVQTGDRIERIVSGELAWS